MHRNYPYFISIFLVVLFYDVTSYKHVLSSACKKYRSRNHALRAMEEDTRSISDPLKLISALSVVGSIETGYLSLSHAFSEPVIGVCSNGISCNTLLNGPYSSIPIIDFPLTYVAFVGYMIVAAISTSQLVNTSVWNKDSLNLILLGITTAMATFSTYLMFLLTFILRSSCPYCYLSAIISISNAIIVWTHKIVPNVTKRVVVSLTSSMITMVASGFLFYVTSALYPEATYATPPPPAAITSTKQMISEEEINLSPPLITKSSSIKAIEIAKRLKKNDAKFYGAYWCSHCYNQKQILGKEAKEYYQYIECDKKGFNTQFDLCRSKKVRYEIYLYTYTYIHRHIDR